MLGDPWVLKGGEPGILHVAVLTVGKYENFLVSRQEMRKK